ncbi:MAG: hypothetical protein BMS9Abin36_0619 [Gammaproteobacteria bacterium]|nr:MAG: hypothetical protein BMS9Abin36_0619 [Gammaproteobacteria bacterium]
MKTASALDQEVERNIKVDGNTTITYKIYKPGKYRRLLVLIHGMASNMTRWSEFVDHTRLTDDWDILRLDLRGHGKSIARKRLGMASWCSDISEILDVERYQDAVIIGHSLGAQVATQFATRYPSRTAGLILIDPVFYQALHDKEHRFYKLRFIPWALSAFIRLLNRLGFYRRDFPYRDLRKLDEETRAALAKSGDMNEIVELYSSPFPDLKQFPIANYIQEMVESLRPNPQFKYVTVPVLSVLAASPSYTNIETTRNIMDKLEQGESVEVHAYHWPLTEQPDETREAIENWCEKTFATVKS